MNLHQSWLLHVTAVSVGAPSPSCPLCRMATDFQCPPKAPWSPCLCSRAFLPSKMIPRYSLWLVGTPAKFPSLLSLWQEHINPLELRSPEVPWAAPTGREQWYAQEPTLKILSEACLPAAFMLSESLPCDTVDCFWILLQTGLETNAYRRLSRWT